VVFCLDEVVELEVFEEVADSPIGERLYIGFLTVFSVGGVGVSAPHRLFFGVA